ncbi:MAG TPA: RluA family pseudouridine synthase [Candidatus Dormibacteraeota bacterium]|jgi:23S rRNA pseudouridine1911/1915/1917 synthase|nr:RluA family pseudouridine synthase [Candidatus Dormibacteraeota bacterium]
MAERYPTVISIAPEDAGQRLDQFLASRMDSVSRARVQQLIAEEKVLVNDAAAKASLKLRGGETVKVLGKADRAPLKAVPEDIPLDIIYEDDDLAVINKAAGMMVHAGAGASEDARNRGTLVNALLHHLGKLSGMGGELRPGIVHRLDKETSGLIIVAKNDEAHRRLGAAFAAREVKKKYMTLVHAWVKKDSGTITQSISRDPVRRTRMTTRLEGGRAAVTHYRVVRRLDTKFGKFTLLDVKIETGRTHQIRVHMAAMGHPVVGDTLYGAHRGMSRKSNTPPVRQDHGRLSPKQREKEGTPGNLLAISLPRNFLHAAELEFRHPRTGEAVALKSELPEELQEFLKRLEE